MFNVHGSERIAATVGEWRFVVCNTTSRKIGHVRVHTDSSPNLTEEASPDDTLYDGATICDPIVCSEVCEGVFRSDVSLSNVFVRNDNLRDMVVTRQDALMTGLLR